MRPSSRARIACIPAPAFGFYRFYQFAGASATVVRDGIFDDPQRFERAVLARFARRCGAHAELLQLFFRLCGLWGAREALDQGLQFGDGRVFLTPFGEAVALLQMG